MSPMNNRILRPLASGFDPRRIAGIGAWFDASDLSTLSQTSDGTTPVTANDNPVAYWRCKVSGTALTQSIDASRPLWKASSAIGGRPGLDFDGADYLFATSGELMKVARNVPGMSVFAVMRHDAVTTRAWWVISIGAGANQFRSRLTASHLAVFSPGGRRLDADTFTSFNTSALSTATNYLLQQIHDHANSDLFVRLNSTQIFSTTSFLTDGLTEDSDSAYVMLGNQFTNDALTGTVNGIDGILCEWIAYRRVLTAGESASVERYLSQKYGI